MFVLSVWHLRILLISLLISWGTFWAKCGLSGGAFEAPPGAFLGPMFGQSRFRRPGKGPEGPPKGPGMAQEPPTDNPRELLEALGRS